MKHIFLTLFASVFMFVNISHAFEYDFYGMVEFINSNSPTKMTDVGGEWQPVPLFVNEVPMPIIELLPQKQIEAFWPGAGVIAMYDSEEYTMYLNENIDPKSIEGYSIILHELVHHVQNVNGLSDTNCPLSLEVDAYKIQLLYLNKNIDAVDKDFVYMISLGQILGTGGICYEDKKF